MTTRLSQKAVEEDFYEACISAGVPCAPKHAKNRGYFLMQYSYGGMQLQYKLVCGGTMSITSGFIGAREMYNKLNYFYPERMYKSYRKDEIRICKSKKENERRRNAA